MKTYNPRAKRMIRHRRVRAKINGTNDVPRVSVFRSNKHLSSQIIDDVAQKTILSINDIREKKSPEKLGEEFAKKAVSAGIKKAVFDRGGYKYHGRIKAFAEGLRKGGLVI